MCSATSNKKSADRAWTGSRKRGRWFGDPAVKVFTSPAEAGGEAADTTRSGKRGDNMTEIEKLKQENETLLLCLELTFAVVELWAKQQGFIQSTLEKDLEKELADRKNEIRALFDKLVKTSEPGFLDGLLGALNIPEDVKHLVKLRLVG